MVENGYGAFYSIQNDRYVSNEFCVMTCLGAQHVVTEVWKLYTYMHYEIEIVSLEEFYKNSQFEAIVLF